MQYGSTKFRASHACHQLQDASKQLRYPFPSRTLARGQYKSCLKRTRRWLVRNAVLLETHWRERERPRCASFRKKKKGATCQMLKTLLVSPSNAEIVRFFILSRMQMRRTHFSIGMSCQACPSLTALTASQLLCDKMLCHGRIF